MPGSRADNSSLNPIWIIVLHHRCPLGSGGRYVRPSNSGVLKITKSILHLLLYCGHIPPHALMDGDPYIAMTGRSSQTSARTQAARFCLLYEPESALCKKSSTRS